MSTFGKKAINWWVYDNHSRENMIRWNHTPKDVQLKILERWFPIGIRVRRYSNYNSRYMKTEYKVIGHIESLSGWKLQVDTTKRLHATDLPDIIPVMVKPIDEDYYKIKREVKLDKIFKC